VTLEELRFAAGRKLARVATRAVVAQPVLWRIFRRPLRAQFDRLAPLWEDVGGSGALAPVAAALDRLGDPPSWILDIGTGTGKAARLAAERFPEAHVVGVDLSAAMVDEARRHLPAGLVGRVRFEVADSMRLPFVDGAFDLVLLLNMIPFFDELARVTASSGTVVVATSSGPSTPIWTPPETLEERLAGLGFGDFEEIAIGAGTAFLARGSGPG
jgi:SAM-dependent methyltransferase